MGEGGGEGEREGGPKREEETKERGGGRVNWSIFTLSWSIVRGC